MIEYQFPLSSMDAAQLLLAHLRSAAWDEDLHPRGKGGKFASKEDVNVESQSAITMYHGTQSEALAAIKEKGILPSAGAGGDAWWRQSHQGVAFDANNVALEDADIAGRHAAAFLTSRPDIAGYFANYAQEIHPGSEPVVLQVKIPRTVMQNLKPDEGTPSPRYGAWRFQGPIKPEWIQGKLPLTHVTPPSKGRLGRLQTLAGAGLTIYVVFLVDQKTRALAFDETLHPRDEKGQWAAAPSGIMDALQQSDGGFTYHVVTGTTPTSGYALSLHKDREQVLNVKDVNLVTLAQYAKANQDLLARSENYLGGWHNPDDGKVYLDVSTVVQKASEAERLARDAHQLAYFDLAHGQSVSVEKKHVTAATHYRGPFTGASDVTRLDRHGAAVDWQGPNTRRDRAGTQDLRGLAFDETLHPRDEKGQFSVVSHPSEVSQPSGPWPVADTTERVFDKDTWQQTEKAAKVWGAALSPEEKKALEAYTSEHNSNQLMNNGLRFPQYADQWTMKTAGQLDSILAKAPTPPPPDVVWRGIHGASAERLASSLKSGDEIQLQGFQSTSLDPYRAHEYNQQLMSDATYRNGVLFEIRPARGGFLGAFSDFKTEFEYLLPHAQHYVVRGIKDVTITGVEGKQTVVQLDMQ